MPGVDFTRALVISARPWSESSRIVTILSPDLGKFRAVCRGVQKAQGGMAAALEPITLSEIVLRQSGRGGMAHISAADAVEYFACTKKSLIGLAAAGGLLELCEAAMPEDEPGDAVFDHLLTLLNELEALLRKREHSERNAINLLWRGILVLSGDFGYGMQFENCVACGALRPRAKGFCLAEGGPVCDACSVPNTLNWGPGTEETLRWLAAAEDSALPERTIPRTQNREIRTLFERYFRFHVPGFDHLRSLDMLVTERDQ